MGSFQSGQDYPIATAAIVAGGHGKGRVVVFGSHPTGGGVHFQRKRTNFSGCELGSDQFLFNALLWAAKVNEPPSKTP